MQPFLTNLLLICAAGVDVWLEEVAGGKWDGSQGGNAALYGKNTSKELENRSDVRVRQQQYRGVVYLGTPPIPFTLIFDTGSSWIWVNHIDCRRNCHPSYTAFDPAKSLTYETTNQQVALSHHFGQARGSLGWDDVSLLPGIGRVQDQALLTLHESKGFEAVESDGILGLGFNALAGGNLTFVENMKKQGIIERAVFAIYLSRSEYGQIAHQKNASLISFGDFDLSQFSTVESLVYIPVISDDGHWALHLDSVSLFGENIVQTSYYAVVDSGTSRILGPDNEVQALLAQFESRWKCSPSGGLLVCACGWDPTLSQFPDIEFVLDGTALIVKPFMYVMRRGTYCQLHIAGIHNPHLWVLGTPFMRGYYTVFDMDDKEIGFAPIKSNPARIDTRAHGTWLIIGALLAAVFCALTITILVCLALKRRRISPREIMLEPFLLA